MTMGAGSAAPQSISNPVWTATDTTASCSIAITGQAYVNNANDTYNGVQINRWNMGRTHRIQNFPGGPLMFKAIATSNSGAGAYLTVVVNNVQFARHWFPDDAFPKVSVVPNVPAGTVEIWEDFQGRTGTLNNGADASIAACYCTHVYLPPGAIMTPAKAAVGVIMGQDSLILGDATYPWITNGVGGQIRAAIQAKGGLVGMYGYGSGTCSGDGKTPAQIAADISRLWANMGSTTKRLIFLPRPNDYAYYGTNGVSTTPAQLLTAYGSVLDTLNGTDTFTCDFLIKVPQGSAQIGNNGGGFSAANYWTQMANINSGRAYVTVWDMTTGLFNLVLTTDYAEATPAVNGVHFGSGGVFGNNGHTKVANAIKTFPNISPFV